MSKQIYYGTSPVPPPGYKAVPIEDEIKLEQDRVKDKKKAIAAGILSVKKSGRVGTTMRQITQLPGQWGKK